MKCIVCGAPADGSSREVFCSIPCGLAYIERDAPCLCGEPTVDGHCPDPDCFTR